MNNVLNSVFENKEFSNTRGEIVKVNFITSTSKEQCLFIQDVIEKNNFKKSLEIGFAYGTSTCAIAESVSKNGGKHLVMDYYERTGPWQGQGIELLKIAGLYEDLEFYEEYCYKMLPRLLEQGRKFDFAYIDSTKLFDWLMLNFFYIDKMLELNGIIIFDDVDFPGIRKLLRYICQLPHYKVESQFPFNSQKPPERRLVKLFKMFSRTRSLLKDEYFHDFDYGINCHCVALRKLGEDKRVYHWYKNV